MRLFSALGPGDIVSAQRLQMDGTPVISETSITFSSQLVAFCKAQGIEALLVSSNPRSDSLKDGAIQLVHIPRRWENAGGWRFHLSRVLYARKLAKMAKAFGADLALIDSGTAHYFALAEFRKRGIPVAVNFHNVRWPQGFPPSGRIGRLIRRLDDRFFRDTAAGAIGCSPACGEQARSNGAAHLPWFEWRGQFRTEGFRKDVPEPRYPFRLLFVGRAEQSKGLLDLAELADRLRTQAKVPVVIDVCGDGSALEALRAMVSARGLEGAVRVHGRLSRPELLPVYGASHAVIVPTRGTFAEGLPLVCAEAVISNRPIVTSLLSNALPVLGTAIEEAKPEDINSFVTAVRRLAEDPDRYSTLQQACPALAEQFLDRAQSYPAAVDRLIAALRPGWAVLPSYEPLFARL